MPQGLLQLSVAQRIEVRATPCTLDCLQWIRALSWHQLHRQFVMTSTDACSRRFILACFELESMGHGAMLADRADQLLCCRMMTVTQSRMVPIAVQHGASPLCCFS